MFQIQWTAHQKIRLGFWLLTLVPIILGAFAVRNAYDLVAAARHVAETNKSARLLEKLFSDIKDVEVAHRTFILLGGQEPIQTIRAVHGEIRNDIQELRKLGADKTWLDLLDQLIPEKMAQIQETIRLREEVGREGASQLLTARGEQAMEDMRTAARNLREEEDRRLERRSREQTKQFEQTLDLFAMILLLNVALIWMIYFLQRGETRRARLQNEELEQRVASRTAALQRSNEDLQQFAYVASHDMKEPLRMISSYTTLLQRRYTGRLDGEADTFINFIVDGVKRLDLLIEDLLEYSRAGSGRDDRLAAVHLETVLRNVMENLKVTIAESRAVIKWESLPESVPYDSVRLAQVFQNLIGNAIKYRGERTPQVRIWSKTQANEIVFSVSDNGIGIKAEYINQIFGIFQRLHGKEYEGTGIGLAMVKKIVERYGGRIWAESTPGVGSTFHFTVLKIAPQSVQEIASTTTT